MIPIVLFSIIGGVISVGILSATFLKTQKMRLENKKGLNSEEAIDLLAEFRDAREENLELKERLNNIETIISGMDKEILQLHSHSKQADYAKEMKELVKKMNLDE